MIRGLKQNDFNNWADLYEKYAKFYKVPMNADILGAVGTWIQDKNHVVNGICYDFEGKIGGIRWITHSSNENAKKLYDKIANNTGFDLYELKRD